MRYEKERHVGSQDKITAPNKPIVEPSHLAPILLRSRSSNLDELSVSIQLLIRF